jgi:hypothetical protein
VLTGEPHSTAATIVAVAAAQPRQRVVIVASLDDCIGAATPHASRWWR